MAKKNRPARPSDEAARIQAVQALKILDTRREVRFDRLSRELAEAMEVPVSFVAIVDAERWWVKSKVGDIATEIERDQSFCAYTIMEKEAMIVPDAREDERFSDLPLVTGEPHLRFYAGVPIKDPQGQNVGTVCAADTKPRTLKASDVSVLKSFAARLEVEINAKDSVFISYAHEDESWKDRLEVHCAIMKRQGLLSVWDDRRIRTGTDWNQQIRQAAERAKAAVLLISADFLASDFIINEEIPLLLERRDAEGVEIFPLLIKPCGWQHVDWLARMNLRPRDGRPLSTGTEAEIESELVEFASELAQTLRDQGAALGTSQASAAVAHTRETAATPSTIPDVEPQRSEAALKAGSRLGSYEILQALGSGGMGQVFVARDSNLKRKVAIKVLKPEMASDPERLKRFQREAETVASLNHPNIVTLFSVEEDRGIRFLTMELVEGETLDKIIPARGLPLERIYEIASPLIEALASAHNRGIVHRDLKAPNVMVSQTGQLKVLDFGLAKLLEKDRQSAAAGTKLTQEGLAVGTFPYMSPEQLEGRPVDARTDIFSLGVLLYEMVTGRMPFAAESSTGLVASILRDVPKEVGELRSRLPESLNGIIQRCLEKDPDKRYQSALDVRNALLKSQEDELAMTLPPGTVLAVPKSTRSTAEPKPEAAAKASKTPLVAGVAAAAVLAIAAGFWFTRGDGGSVAGDAADQSEPRAESRQASPPLATESPSSEPQAQPPARAETPTGSPPSRQPPPAANPQKRTQVPSATTSPPSRSEPTPRPSTPSREAAPTSMDSPSAVAAGAVEKEAPASVAPVTPEPRPRPAAPEPPPPEPAPDPREAVLGALEGLARAYESLDAGAVLKLWPGAPGEKLAASFAQMKSLEVEIRGCRIDLAGNDRATASCTEKQSMVGKAGPALPPIERSVQFNLRRDGDSWLVESRQ